ncbi:hypothetical protein VK70_18865 [Paenibacillus durus ATCC 35681]|uniref:Uncharacterized protein n=1 Tax=Paenibacillus durus ATCC 35681 TaxID=1333534 RepID=A0A0F7FD41_PAEDU|nr:hypothetical protein VK70_18865 [Paenibacillus durus ATCC 35681]
MKSRIRHLLDYGEYCGNPPLSGDEENKCIGKHAVSNEPGSIREEAEAYDSTGDDSESVTPQPTLSLFWSFPQGRGVRQPWRSRLWEHQRDQL